MYIVFFPLVTSMELFGDFRSSLKVQVDASASVHYDNRKTLLSKAFPSVSFNIAIIPVQLQLTAGLDGRITVDGEAQGQAIVGLAYSKYMSSGFEIIDGHYSPLVPVNRERIEPTFSFTYDG